jgi:Na+-translocating ferredoxin:NAD+ oxidoreductase RnfG subunit
MLSITHKFVSVLVALFALSAPAQAEVFFSVRDLLGSQFARSQKVTFVTVRPTGEQRARIQRELGRDLAKQDYTFYVATTADRVDGYALFDEERGQHEPITFATFFDAAGRVTRVEVVAYREPFGDAIRGARFRRQFVGRDAHSGFTLAADIDAVSGATISSNSLSIGVRRASVLLDETLLKNRPVLAAR